jgi:arginase family enzyme
MDVHDYLDYLNSEKLKYYDNKNFVIRHVTFLNENTTLDNNLKYDLALLGLPDSEESNTFEATNQIREQLYSLCPLSNNLNIIDLGNIKKGHTFIDTCFAIREIVAFTNYHNIVIVLIGGISKYNVGSFLAFEKSKSPLNMVAVDSVINRERIPLLAAIDLKLNDSVETSSLFNFINVAYQSYFVDKGFIDFLNDSYYEAYRLGFVRTNLPEIEPGMRDANLVSFSLNSVKHCDAPGAIESSPNGLTGEEACQISFYAGHSNRIKSFGIHDLSTPDDYHSTTAKLAAQIIWYFIEGHSSSIYEEPDVTPENFIKFLIHLDQTNQNIAFYKSNLTNRWWMEICYPKVNRNILLSCSESDYEIACRQEIPDRWWRTFQRIQL